MAYIAEEEEEEEEEAASPWPASKDLPEAPAGMRLASKSGPVTGEWDHWRAPLSPRPSAEAAVHWSRVTPRTGNPLVEEGGDAKMESTTARQLHREDESTRSAVTSEPEQVTDGDGMPDDELREGEKCEAISTFLLQQGFSDVNAKKRLGSKMYAYPLHVVAEWGDSQLAAFLLEEGADPRLRNSSGHTPVEVAVRNDSGGSHAEVIRVLSEALPTTAGEKNGKRRLFGLMGRSGSSSCKPD
jgi:hypothetical protein